MLMVLLWQIRRASGQRRVRTRATVPVPSSWSSPAVLAVLQSFWTPWNGVLGRVRDRREAPSNSVILFLSPPKTNHEIDDDFKRFSEPKWSPKSAKIHPKIDSKMDVVFDTVFGSIWNVFGRPQTLKIYLSHWRGVNFHKFAVSKTRTKKQWTNSPITKML